MQFVGATISPEISYEEVSQFFFSHLNPFPIKPVTLSNSSRHVRLQLEPRSLYNIAVGLHFFAHTNFTLWLYRIVWTWSVYLTLTLTYCRQVDAAAARASTV